MSIRRRRMIRWMLAALALPPAGLLLLYLAVWMGLTGPLPGRAELAAIRNEQATLVLARDGSVIGKIFDRDRTNVGREDLPQHLVDALIAVEDRRFLEHKGVDAWSYLRVFFRGVLMGENKGGGSTISQQVIKNLYGRRGGGMPGLLVDKMREMVMARRLEEVYTKEEVILLYLNSVPFGENAYGIEAAAQRFFGTHARDLRVEEAAVLVGVLKANTTYNPRLHPEAGRARRDEVLRLMGGHGALSAAAVDSLQQLPLVLDPRGADAYDAYGYFVDRVAAQARAILADHARRTGSAYDLKRDGLRIHTTLDTALQQLAIRSARAHMRAVQPAFDRDLRRRKQRTAWEKRMRGSAGSAWVRNERRMRRMFEWNAPWTDSISYRDSLWHYERMLNAAVLLMEPRTGHVLAWVGGNDHRFLPFDLVTAPHPIASTIKPFLYAAALEQGFDPCSRFDNQLRSYPEFEGWTPANYDDSSGGQAAMWYALSRSLNLPTVDLYFRTGPAAIERTFARLGLPTDGLEHPASALGANDMSLLQAVRGYSAFAAEGRPAPGPVLIERITTTDGRSLYKAPGPRSRQAIDASTAAAITAMLQRAVNEGTGSALRAYARGEVAGKTGTAQDHANAWFIAYSPALVCGAWVGCRDPAIHAGGNSGSGARMALPIVGGVLAAIERRPAWRKRYMRPFTRTVGHDIDLDCPALRDPSGLERAIDDLLGPPHRRGKATDDTDRPAGRKKKKKDGLFHRLFDRKR